jgi:hypothetical protein
LTYIFDFSLAEEIEFPHNTAYLRVLVRNYPLQDIQLSKIEKLVGPAVVRLRPGGLRRDSTSLRGRRNH